MSSGSVGPVSASAAPVAALATEVESGYLLPGFSEERRPIRPLHVTEGYAPSRSTVPLFGMALVAPTWTSMHDAFWSRRGTHRGPT